MTRSDVAGYADPTTAAAEGVEGNSRLTAANGMVLLVMLAVEGFTVLSVRDMLTLHIFLGVMLLGPVLLKVASTLYRFVRYYRGSAPYREKGPPHPVLRVMGPLVIVSSLALLGTGVALLAFPPNEDSTLLTLHQGSFIVWVALMSVHVLAHIREAAVTSWRELRASTGAGSARGRRWRFALVALALVAGVGTAAALMPSATGWTTAKLHDHEDRGGR
jgi:hypothetical protein